MRQVARARRVVVPTDSQAYAIALVEAWERGDRDVAATLAGPAALETLFSREGGGAATWSLEDCEGAMGSTYCTFRADGEPSVIVRVGNEAVLMGEPQAVTEVRFEG